MLEEREKELEQAGLELLDYDKRGGWYRIRLSGGDFGKHEALMTELLKAAYDARGA